MLTAHSRSRFHGDSVIHVGLAVCFSVIAVPCAAASTETTSLVLAKAEISKWIDDDGQVHYGDAPPADANAERLRVQPNVIEIDRPTAPTRSTKASGKPDASIDPAPMTVPVARPEIDRYVARCRDNRGVDCELEAQQMIDGPAPVVFPGDPAVFPRPDLKPPPPGLDLKYSITP